jgi:hypothetical protein
MDRKPVGVTAPYRENNKRPDPTPAPGTPKEWVEWVEYAQAKMRAMETKIATLEEKNAQYKKTIRQMDRRIMQG